MSVLWFDSALQVILTVNKGLSEDVLINCLVTCRQKTEQNKQIFN